MPLSRNSPVALDAHFAQFVPAGLKSLRHPKGGGGYPFLTDTPRRGTKILWRLRGGYAFFMGTFPKKNNPPPQQEILNSPLLEILSKDLVTLGVLRLIIMTIDLECFLHGIPAYN